MGRLSPREIPPQCNLSWPAAQIPTITEDSIEHQSVKFFANRWCPYSQRVWIGLEEKHVEFNWVEIDLYDRRESAIGKSNCRLSMEELALLYPSFTKCSPRGEIPAMDNCDEHVEHSLIILEYIQEVFRGPPLLPTLPRLRAHVRTWTWHVNSHVVPNFDRLLGAQDEQSLQQARAALLQGLADYEAAMAPEAEGPFFLGDDFSMADIALAPFWWRMCSVLRAYRRFDASAFPRLQVWFEAVEARPSFSRTAIDSEALIKEFPAMVDTTVDELLGSGLSKPFLEGTIFRRNKSRIKRNGVTSSDKTYSDVSSH